MKKFIYLVSAATLAFASCSDDLGLKNQEVGFDGVSRVLASMPVAEQSETRTSVTIEGGKYVFQWNPGDDLGVYGALASQYVNNARYHYTGNTDEQYGEFSGQITIPEGETFYAYYPYNSGLTGVERSDGSITIPLQIGADQTFNSIEAAPVSGTMANGSFSAGSVPAVAVATSATEGELEFKFQPQASYLVFPLVGIGNLQQVELSITAPNGVSTGVDQGNYYLAGSIPATVTEDGDVSLGEFQGISTTITLSCGNYPLSMEEAVNLWFVVPSGLELKGATINLDVTGSMSSEPQHLERPLEDYFANQGTITKVNDVRWMGQSAVYGDWFEYNADMAVLTTASQFLEYQLFIQHGETLYNLWEENGGSNLSYSSLGDMVVLNSGSYESIKPAYIPSIIDLTPSTFKNWLNGVNEWQSNAYYNTVFSGYYTNSYIPTIVTPSGFNITGAVDEDGNPVGGLKGLVVKGNGIIGTAVAAGYLENLQFNSCVVDATDASADISNFFNGWGIQYKNIVLDSNCKLTPSTESTTTENGVSVTKQGVFSTVLTSSINAGYNEVSESIANLPFAYELDVNSDYNFTTEGNPGVDDFTVVNIVPNTSSGSEGYGALLTIEDPSIPGNPVNALALIAKVENNEMPYSVVDSEYSYWTGTSGSSTLVAPGTAEQLASIVQNAETNGTYSQFVPGDYSLNLMGSEVEMLNTRWWNSGGYVEILGTEEAPLNITNVYIDGTSDGDTPGAAYSFNLLGGTASVSFLNVSNITLDNSVSKVQSWPLGAIAAGSGTTVNNLTVSGVTEKIINTVAETTQYAGALFGQVVNDMSNFEMITLSDYNRVIAGTTGTVAFGYIAGRIDYTIAPDVETFEATLTNPVKYTPGYIYPFGQWSISVPTPSSSSVNYNLILDGFNEQLNLKDLTFLPSGSSYPDKGYTFYVTLGTKQYIYQYQPGEDGNAGEYTYYNIVGAN